VERRAARARRVGPRDAPVAQADGLAERGEAPEALNVYELVLRDYPADPASAAALYGLGRLQAAPGSPLRNYRAAHAAFSRLLTEHPQSRWESEARAWRAVLGDLIAREDDTARLKAQLERLRRTDPDLERRR
jgi:TolA-binding protein